MPIINGGGSAAPGNPTPVARWGAPQGRRRAAEPRGDAAQSQPAAQHSAHTEPESSRQRHIHYRKYHRTPDDTEDHTAAAHITRHHRGTDNNTGHQTARQIALYCINIGSLLHTTLTITAASEHHTPLRRLARRHILSPLPDQIIFDRQARS